MGRKAIYIEGEVRNGAVLLHRLPNRKWMARCKCGKEFVISNITTTRGKCAKCTYEKNYGALTEAQEQIIVAMCDNRLNMSEVGRKLYMTTGAVQWNCNNIKKKTGYDPRDFWDMQKLLELMKGKQHERKTD